MSSLNPRLIIQSDWNEAMKDKHPLWLQFKSDEGQNIYGSFSSSTPSEDDIFQVSLRTPRVIDVSFESSTCRFIAPKCVYAKIHQKSVVCIDVTQGGLGVSSSLDGTVKIWETLTGEERRILPGHIDTTYVCKFFPSGIVVLSGGSDLLMKVCSAEDSSCAVTLRGHCGAIQDVSMIDRGRCVVSASRDGTVRLWNVASAKCLDTLVQETSPINTCDVIHDEERASGSPSSGSESEVGTGGKLLLTGGESGALRVTDIRSRQLVAVSQIGSAINCCRWMSASSAMCGTEEGEILEFDTRKLDAPLSRKKEQRGPILSLLTYQGMTLATCADGSAFATVTSRTCELTGPNCEPVYGASCDGHSVFTCSRDGKIRKYDFNDFIVE